MSKLFNVLLCLVLFTGNIHAGGKSYSSSSSKSYSSSPSKSYSSSPSKGISSSSNKSYSSGSSSSYSKPKGNFQSLGGTEQKKAESRAVYQKATAPKDSYTTPKGNKIDIKKDDVRVTQIRNISEEKWVHRETRVQTFYSSYYHVSPVIVYNDPYSNFFWLWMLDRSLDDRAYWAYNHRDNMDSSRYHDLLTKDKALEARIRQLEVENKARDPNYVPKGMDDADLQYTDEYVNAVYNPEEKSSSWGMWIFISFLAIILVVGAIWVIFFLRF